MATTDTSTTLRVVNESLRADHLATLRDDLLSTLQHFQRHSLPHTQVLALSVYEGDRFIGLAAGVMMRRRPLYRLLVPSPARWAARLLGPLGLKTSVLFDTSFMAYDYASPFRVVDHRDRRRVANAALNWAISQPAVDSVMIAEPTPAATFADDARLDSFPMTPMVHVNTSAYADMSDFVSQLSKKRRRNYHAAVRAMKTHDVEIELCEAVSDEQMEAMLHCLKRSAQRSSLYAPYQDALVNSLAFRGQPQSFLITHQHGVVVGFAGYVCDGNYVLQTHGGLDYEFSIPSHAYHNLMYGLIERAIHLGCRAVSFGPLNNETKRRIGSSLQPLTASVWNRKRLDRRLARKVFLPRFQICLPSVDG